MIGILNVGAGDTKLIFDPSNPAECIRAARIVTDMLKRGYALLVEVERNGTKGFQRIKEFDPEKYEYIIADFDPTVESKDDEVEAAPAPAKISLKGTKSRRIPASSTRAVAVPPTAGG